MKFSSYLNSYRVIPIPVYLHIFLSLLQERRQLCMDARTTFEVAMCLRSRVALHVDDGETVERLAQAMASSHPESFQPGTVVRFLEEIFMGGKATNHA